MTESAPSPLRISHLRICRADYHNPVHADAVVVLLDAYARDAAGGGEPLSDFAKSHLVKELAARDRKSTRLNSSHIQKSRMPSSA